MAARITTPIVLLLLSVCVRAEAWEPTRDAGPHEVVRAEILLHDATRQKDLPLLVTAPKSPRGPMPTIVFSHGAGGAGEGVSALTRFWASHGYACIAPTHDDSIALRRQRGQLRETTLDEAMAGTLRQVFSDPAFAANRVKDLKLVLDNLARIEADARLAAALDGQRVGVGGHSFGAHTTMCIGGMRRPTAASGEEADPRPKAFLVLSGQGTGRGLTAQSWKDFSRPMLSMTGSLDRSPDGKGPDWRRENYDHAPPGDKYFVFIEGAHHGSFTGSFASDNPRARTARRALRGADFADDDDEVTAAQKVIFGDVKQTTLAFWDAYLCDQAGAKAHLVSNVIEKQTGGRTKVEHK